MCGIVGTANWGDSESLQQMNAVQRHRGPDDSGVWEHRSPDGTYIGLGSRRLAILDLSSDGHMPMSNHDGSVVITYNGEVYNFRELRDELISKGHSFHSQTDTEVVLRLYEEEGPRCIRRLRGIFAFAICDLRGAYPKLVLARDHFGVKPLYYTQRGTRLAFASEAKSLFHLPGLNAEVDPQSLDKFLTFLWVPDPDTLFRGVKKLPAGHYAIFENGRFSLHEYWDLKFPPAEMSFRLPEEALAEQVRERFRLSVRAQMMSDVPLGAFLSAGLDSTSIVAMMAETSDRPVRTYTIAFPPRHTVGETTLDDPAVATRVAQHFGCDHQQIVVEPDVVGLLPKLVWHMDEPTADPAIIAAYLVCHEARKSVTVLLSGVGGDEIFAGYRKHIAAKWGSAYRRLPAMVRRSLSTAVQGIPAMRGTPLKGMVRLGKKLVRSAHLSPQDAFLMNSTYMDSNLQNELLSPEHRAQSSDDHPWSRHKEYFDRVHGADPLNQMLYLDSKAFMTSLNLNYNDKMSMASSVEARVPFLDPDLVEWVAWNVPPEFKLRGTFAPTTKYILRKAMKDILPREIFRQPKAGFFAPVDYWLADDLREMVDDVLSPGRLRERGYFDPDVVWRLIHEQRSGQQDWAMQIWQLLTFELWMQAFIDARPSSQVSAFRATASDH